MRLFDPKSIAIIGASATEGKVGHDVLKNIMSQGFLGKVYPVNPKGGEILGKRTYPSIKDIEESIDLAIIVTPAPTVLDLVRECGKKSIKAVIVISAGFKEIGTPEGKEREEMLRSVAKEHDITLIGANCLGMLRPSIGLNASFAKELPPKGNIALISQSGALAVALMDAAEDRLRMGFSVVVSIGNKTGMDESDLLEACLEDTQTTVIGLYVESIEDGPRLREILTRNSGKKPIVLLKSGTSDRGRRAVQSHTGALAGSDGAVEAVCRQTGTYRARSLEEFADLLRTLSMQPTLLSSSIAIVTNAGGPGILATDEAIASGLSLATLGEKTAAVLKKELPPAAGKNNPVDVLGDAMEDRYASALEACLDDIAVDGVCVLLTPQVMTPCAAIAEMIVKKSKKFPLFPVVVSFMGGKSVAEAEALLHAGDIPSLESPERAIRALAALRKRETYIPSTPFIDEKRRAKARTILEGKNGQIDSKNLECLATLYKLPLPATDLARSKEEAGIIAERLGYPLIAKIAAASIIHKTDVGGIRANIKNKEEAVNAYDDIVNAVSKNCPSIAIDGVLLQQFLPAGNEFLVGGFRDPVFGPLLLVGLGGIYAELFKDTSMRLCPIAEGDAYAMLEELQAWKLLMGMRGASQSDVAALVALMQNVSSLMLECEEITELDCNPVIVREAGLVVADAKIIVECLQK